MHASSQEYNADALVLFASKNVWEGAQDKGSGDFWLSKIMFLFCHSYLVLVDQRDNFLLQSEFLLVLSHTPI